jgi:YrbI family 3-deoxy-D-manno-octulosonate 8-phosphate phosphatase
LNQDGEEFVATNRKDGLAINRLKVLGITVVITSTETNKVVTARATKLGIEALQGLSNKVEAIESYLSKHNLTWNDSWYIGNDVNDLGAIRKAKFSICPIDAVKAVKKEVDLKVKTKGVTVFFLNSLPYLSLQEQNRIILPLELVLTLLLQDLSQIQLLLSYLEIF